MPLGQGWLNAWVKVNNKHVVYNNRTDDEGNPIGKSPDTLSSLKTTKTATSHEDDVQKSMSRRLSLRKNKRRISRARSSSDLIREAAKLNDEAAREDAAAFQSELDRSTSTQITANHKGGTGGPSLDISERSASILGVPSEDYSARHPSLEETEESLRFVAGLFGADIEMLSHGAAQGNASEDKEVSLAVSAASNRSKFPQNVFFGDEEECRHCNSLQSELCELREDMDFLRNAALLRNKKSVCSRCEENVADGANSPTIRDDKEYNSEVQMVATIISRYKGKLDQMTKDKKRLQRNAEVKLKQYASLCKDLNEEATLRNEEVISLHREVDSLRSERNSIASELESSRATIAMYERDTKERKLIEQRLRFYESHGLDGAETAIRTRDGIISDLSIRLERSLDALQGERERQRQRRQIIFPTQRSSSTDQVDLLDELKETKTKLHETQIELQDLQEYSRANEALWQKCFDDLEQRLKS